MDAVSPAPPPPTMRTGTSMGAMLSPGPGGALREHSLRVPPVDGRMPVGVQRSVRVELPGEVAHGRGGGEREVASEEDVARFREGQEARQRGGAAGERGVEVEAPEILEDL